MEAQRFVFRIEKIGSIVDSTTKRQPRYKGRNGWGVCTGIAFSIYNGTCLFHPFNSKGEISQSCQLGIPDDPIVLRQISEVLLNRAKVLETSGESANG